MAVAMLAAVMLTVLTAGSVLAQGHVANDGQTLEMQSPEVQAIYASVWGDNAAMRWAADHNAAIGQVAPQAQHPRYDEVFHVAYTRSMDMELAGRITADVIARGTIDQFMAGMDMGVLYGYVAPAPQPAAAPSGGGSSTSSTSSTPSTPTTTTGTGLFEGVSFSVPPLILGDESGTITAPPVSVTYTGEGDDAYGSVMYTEIEGLPEGLTAPLPPAELSRQITGTPLEVGTFEISYMASQTRGTEEAENYDVVSSTFTFTIQVLREAPADLMPTFGSASIASHSYFQGSVPYLTLTLPTASGGNGELTYALAPADPLGMVWTSTTRQLIGRPTVGESGLLTYTATDMDPAEGNDADMATLTFTIEVVANVVATVTTPGPATATVGTPITAIAIAGEGNLPLEFSVTGLPSGLTYSSTAGFSTGFITGTPDALAEGITSQDYSVSITVTDAYGETSDPVSFTITVSASEG